MVPQPFNRRETTMRDVWILTALAASLLNMTPAWGQAPAWVLQGMADLEVETQNASVAIPVKKAAHPPRPQLLLLSEVPDRAPIHSRNRNSRSTLATPVAQVVPETGLNAPMGSQRGYETTRQPRGVGPGNEIRLPYTVIPTLPPVASPVILPGPVDACPSGSYPAFRGVTMAPSQITKQAFPYGDFGAQSYRQRSIQTGYERRSTTWSW